MIRTQQTLGPWRVDRADGMTIEWDVGICMDDGVVLHADVFRPMDAGRYPVILSYGPYGKGLPFQQGYAFQWQRLSTAYPEVLRGSTGNYQNWEVVDPEKWVPDGYVCVRVDSRGAGRSPGYLDPFSSRETRDFHDCIEWAGERDWSSGQVGLLGISYYAINQWQVATLQPPHLAAICPWEGAADWYRDMVRHGGIMSVFFPNWMGKQVVTVQHGLGDRGPVNPNTGQPVAGPANLTDAEMAANRVDMRREVLQHALDDEYFQERLVDWSRVSVPILSAGNWGGQGLHLRGNVEGFVRAASDRKWLELHGQEHWTEFYTDYGLALQKRFFERYLKGVDNGWERDQPRVVLQVRHVDGFVQREEQAWPLERTQWTRLFLDATTRSLVTNAPSTQGQVGFDAAADGVTFFGAPVPEATELTGPLAATLFVESSTTDVDVFLILQVFDPDGREVDFQGALDPHTPIGQGWLRGSQRQLDESLSTPWRPYHSHGRAEPLAPGEVYQMDIEIWPTSIVVPAGYRLALTVQGKDLQRPGAGAQIQTFVNEMRGSGPFLHDDPDDRPADIFAGRIGIHTGGKHASCVLLPRIPRAS